MTENAFMGYVLVPILIFLIRIADVSMGTMRIIFISRGIRYFAAVLGFFEVLIWLVAISQVINNLQSPVHYIAYAAGFGMGNFVGVTIERKLSLGSRVVRIITRKDAAELVKALRDKGYGVTSVEGEGSSGSVKVVFSIVRRNQVSEVVASIKEFNPKAFFTVEDIRFVNEKNVFPLEDRSNNIFSRMAGFTFKRK